MGKQGCQGNERGEETTPQPYTAAEILAGLSHHLSRRSTCVRGGQEGEVAAPSQPDVVSPHS